MSTTTYYDIDLPSLNSEDWAQVLHQAFSQITEFLVENQKPANVVLRWGDITNGKYLECSSQGVKVVGNLDFALGKAEKFVIDQGSSFPADTPEGRMFYRTDEEVLYVRTSTSWQAMGAVTTAAVDTAGATMNSDFGIDAGTFLVLNNSGNVVTLSPSGESDGTIVVRDNTQAKKWKFQTFTSKVSEGYASGSLRVGDGAGSTTLLVLPGTNPGGRFLTIDPVSPTVLKWATPSDAVAQLFSGKGQIPVGTGNNTGALLSAPALDQILLGAPGETEGMKWAARFDDGATPEDLGTAATGTDVYAARRDHVHDLPTVYDTMMAKVYDLGTPNATADSGVATIAENASEQNTVTGPDVPRNLRMAFPTYWNGGNLTAEGTDQFDATVTETFVASAGSTVVGAKIFKAVTKITNSFPGGTGADSATIGPGSKLGIDGKIESDGLFFVYEVAEAAESWETLNYFYVEPVSGSAPDGSRGYKAIANVYHNHGLTG